MTGALYYNDGTVLLDNKGMWIWDGVQWIKASAATQAILVTYEYLATAGQTTFSGNDANGVPLAYTVGSIIVSLNGVKLRPGNDFTASNGTSVVLVTGAAAGDDLVIDAFSTFDVANMYTKAEVDGFAVKLTGSQSIAGVKTFADRPLFSGGIDLNANGQIKFPATQNASSDANTLDDYEEGTWTPRMTRGTTDQTMTYSMQNGRYIKIGKQVTVYGAIAWTANSGGSGTWRISDFPFQIANPANIYPHMYSLDHTGFTYGSGCTMMGAYGIPGANSVTLYSTGSGVSAAAISGVASTGYIYFNMTYEAST